MNNAQAQREAILHAPLEINNHGEMPEPGTLYIPSSHLKALRLGASLVVGDRGVGKSFWTAALQSDELRKLISPVESDLSGVEVAVGFAEKSSVSNYPDRGVIERFLDNGGDAYDLWRAVVVRWVAKRTSFAIPVESWDRTIQWIKNYPEQVALLMEQPRTWRGLILFDALDRTSNDWNRMDKIVRGLLQTVLWLKSYSGLFAKVFLRPDQAARTVNFPDASKLLSTRAELVWMRHDLHGMLWQRLINAPGVDGICLREICPHEQRDSVWSVTAEMKTESETQRKTFEKLAGPWMGRDKRRGVPYVWSNSHLADSLGRTSPRSFLAAIEQATEDSKERYATYEFALHYESIKRGIEQASQIRVQEISEEYAWIRPVLEILSGTNVPCERSDIEGRWDQKFPGGPTDIPSGTLPAQHAERGWKAIWDELERLGLVETKKDGRINMPDLYRLGFGLGRKGGVKPRS